MSDTMTERVARAVALWVGYMGVLDTMPPADPGGPSNDAWIETNFRPFLTVARAAIEAMRVPTEKMEDAAWGTDRQNVGEHGNTLIPIRVWQAMIDQILDERADP